MLVTCPGCNRTVSSRRCINGCCRDCVLYEPEVIPIVYDYQCTQCKRGFWETPEDKNSPLCEDCE